MINIDIQRTFLYQNKKVRTKVLALEVNMPSQTKSPMKKLKLNGSKI
jgi:hypothetical protein